MNSTYLHYFLILRRAFQDIKNHSEITISMNELMDLFFCTQRNAKIIMSKLTEERVLQFNSGRGRGNKSTLMFLVSLEETLRNQMDLYLKNQEINRAIELVKEFGEGTEVENEVLNWLREYFGYGQLQAEDRHLDVLRFPIYRPITTIDPSQVFFDLDAHLVMQVFNTLVQYDFTKGEFQGCLAHSWETNEEKTKWLFFLRKGVLFHNGKEVTAEAVKRSILRLGESPHSWLVEDIKEIEVLSDYDLLFRLTKPNELFLHFVSFTPMSIVDTSSKGEGLAQYPIGSGPFRFVRIESDFCVLQAFESYFQTRAHMDRIEIIRMADSIRETLLRGTEIAVVTGENEVNPKEWKGNKTIFSGTSVLSVNSRKKGPLQDVGVRRGLHQMLKKASVASGFTLEGHKPTDLNVFESEFTVVNTDCTLSLYTYSRHAPEATLIQNVLQDYGVELQVNIVDWARIQRQDVLENADMILFEGTPNEGIISVMDLLLCENGFIYPFLSNFLMAEVKERVDQLKRTKSVLARYEVYRNLESFLQEKGVLLFLSHKQVEAVYSDLLEGVKFSSRMWVDFKELWYKQHRMKDL